MQHVFGKNIDLQGGEYGNAILSRFPIVEHQHTRYRVSISGEQRGLLSAVIGVPGREVLLLNTHLDFKKDDEERLANVAEALATLAEREKRAAGHLLRRLQCSAGKPHPQGAHEGAGRLLAAGRRRAGVHDPCATSRGADRLPVH